MSTTVNQFTVAVAGDRGMHMERIFQATRERVWAAYTQPELISQWWAQGGHCEVVKWEFERGGHWRFETAGFNQPDERHGFEGRFREIVPMERIVQTFEWDGLPGHVAIESAQFVDLGDGRTKVVLDNLFHTTEERDGMIESGMEQGMAASYAALDELLAKP